MRRIPLFVLAALLVLLPACGDDNGNGSDPTATGASTSAPTAAETLSADETPSTPGAQVPSVEPSSDIVLPPGFAAYPIATGFLRATAVAVARTPWIHVSERGGTVYRLVDRDADGVYEQKTEFASGFDTITGIMLRDDGTLYVSSTGKITTVLDTDDDGVGDEVTDIITGLPNGRHQNNGLVIGPDNKLYVTNGSTCDDCLEPDERSATILQSNLDGSELRVYARGLRNPYDITFDAGGRLWATDNGSDAPCATDDELNLIVDGGDYGWPYGNDACDETTDGMPAYASLGLHTAATGITTFWSGNFPEGYYGSLFATVWGSLFADPEPYDRQLLHIPINPPSMPDERIPESVDIEVFASGFEHPIDVENGGGSLLVLDYGSDDPNARTGTLYRIIYSGA